MFNILEQEKYPIIKVVQNVLIKIYAMYNYFICHQCLINCNIQISNIEIVKQKKINENISSV